MPAACNRLSTEVWLASPRAARFLDRARLDPADRLEGEGLHTARRRLDWESSRALQQHAAAAARPGRWSSSLSHSHGYAAMARAAPGVSVGVDLEWLTPRDFRSMARTAYTPEEACELESLEDPDVLCARFYEYWTLKEAFAKALRLPLADALGQCCFATRAPAVVPRLSIRERWRAVVYAPRPMLRLAVVRLSDAAEALAAPLCAMEWPPQRAASWSVVRRLEGRGPGGDAPC